MITRMTENSKRQINIVTRMMPHMTKNACKRQMSNLASKMPRMTKRIQISNEQPGLIYITPDKKYANVK